MNDERTQAPGARAPARVRPRGRRSDGPSAVLRRAVRGSSEAPAVVLGHLLLLASGAVFTLTVPLLTPTASAWRAIGAVSAVMLVVLLVSLRLPWNRLPPATALVLPALPLVALAVLNLVGGVATPYGGLWVLAFTVTGLTQSARTNWLALVPATLTYVLAIGTFTAEFGIRVIIAAAVWMLVAQLLVRLTSQQRRLAGDLRSAAHTDALTGLGNRRDLDRRLARLAPGDSVVICDLDHFKALNDRHGHVAGDRVLADFGTLLRVGLRDGDYAARYGGEEFALVLPATTAAQAAAVVDRLRERWAILQPATFSAGTATMLSGGLASDVVTAADGALYEAKGAGRKCTRTAAAA